jgi:hypothetical protein
MGGWLEALPLQSKTLTNSRTANPSGRMRLAVSFSEDFSMDAKLINQAVEWVAESECPTSTPERIPTQQVWLKQALTNLLARAVATYLCFQAEAELNKLREEVTT